MTKWIAVPICPECEGERVMEPDEDGNYVCPQCDELIEGEDEEDF